MQTQVDDELMEVRHSLLPFNRLADIKVVFLYKLIPGVAESSHGTRKSSVLSLCGLADTGQS